MSRRKRHRLEELGGKMKAIGVAIIPLARKVHIDLIDISVVLIGMGVWWIEPAWSLITVGTLLLVLGVFFKHGTRRKSD